MSAELPACACRWTTDVHVMCPQHFADLEARLAEEPRVIPVLFAAIKKRQQ